MGCVASVKSDCNPFNNLNISCIDRNHRNREADDVGPYRPGVGDVMAEGNENVVYDNIEDVDEHAGEDVYTDLDDTVRDQETYAIPNRPPDGADNTDPDVLTGLSSVSPAVAAKLTIPQVRASVALSLSDLTAMSPTVEDFNRRFLECSICLEQYKNPKILPCYHSFCQECLLKAYGEDVEKIPCPICKREHQLPGEGGVKALPNCTILNDLIEFAKPAQKDESVSVVRLCGGCKKRAAENFCVDCGILICADCRDTHKNIPVTKKHQLMSLDEYRDKILVQSQVYRPVVCPLHEGNQITHYCGSCEAPVCEECTLEKHRRQSHQLELLKEAASKRRAQLKQKIKAGDRRAQELRQQRSVVEVEEKASLEKLSKESEIINSGFQEIITKLQNILKYLENEKGTLVKVLEENRDKRQSSFEQQKRQISASLTDVSKCVSEACTLLQHSNEVGFLYLANRTTAKINKALGDATPPRAADCEPLTFSAEEKLQKLQTTVVDMLLVGGKT